MKVSRLRGKVCVRDCKFYDIGDFFVDYFGFSVWRSVWFIVGRIVFLMNEIMSVLVSEIE